MINININRSIRKLANDIAFNSTGWDVEQDEGLYVGWTGMTATNKYGHVIQAYRFMHSTLLWFDINPVWGSRVSDSEQEGMVLFMAMQIALGEGSVGRSVKLNRILSTIKST